MLTAEALQAQHDYEVMDALENGELSEETLDGCSVIQCADCLAEDDCTALEMCVGCGNSICRVCLEDHIELFCTMEEGS